MISTKADGANINMGKYNGTLTMMARERSWLMVIHCMNHHIKLTITDMVISVNKFEECDKFYNTIFNLFKNSGKLKSATKEACTASNITYYCLSKVHSTRFVNYRRRGFTALLHEWPALILSFTNALSSKGLRPKTKAKIKGVLDKLKDYRFLCCASYLESISPLPLIFEKKKLMAYEVKPAVEKTLLNLQELSKETLADNAIDSFLHKFSIQSNDDEDNGIKISAIYLKKDHRRRKPSNCKMIEIELDDMKNANMRSIKEALNLRLSSIKSLVLLIQDRFSSFTESEVIAATTWVDPKL